MRPREGTSCYRVDVELPWVTCVCSPCVKQASKQEHHGKSLKAKVQAAWWSKLFHPRGGPGKPCRREAPAGRRRRGVGVRPVALAVMDGRTEYLSRAWRQIITILCMMTFLRDVLRVHVLRYRCHASQERWPGNVGTLSSKGAIPARAHSKGAEANN